MPIDDAKRIEVQMQETAVVRLWNALLPLKSVISFLDTGAHPDDETSGMLATLVRRDGFHMAHACSTRGEGGQNALGTELTEDLGMVRTREMERAAKVLDMTQYWLGENPEDTIFDFGFSKSGKETLAKWGHERTLDRFVRILRTERPDIVCPTFLDIPGQHGHHRAMTQAAHEAVVMAADPSVFTHHFDDGLSVWQVKKLYLPAWSGAGDSYDDDLPPPPETVRIDASGRDPVLGVTYAQIGQWSRVFHKTQGMGRWIESGESASFPLHLAWTADGRNSAEDSIADGLPGTLADLAKWADAEDIAKPLAKADARIAEAIAAWPDNAKAGEAAAKALKHVRKAIEKCPKSAKGEVLHRLVRKERELSRVIFEASGVAVRAIASASEIPAGGSTTVAIHLDDPLGLLDAAPEVELLVPDGWSVRAQKDGQFDIQSPDDAHLADPYPDTYDPLGANGIIKVRVKLTLDGVSTDIACDLEEPVLVLPKVEADIAPAAVIYNFAAPDAIIAKVSSQTSGDTQLNAPDDWVVKKSGAGFEVSPSSAPEPGLYRLPVAVDGTPAMTLRRASYAHTGTIVRALPTTLDIRVLSAELPDARIGYVAGGSDRAGYWMSALGLDVVELDDGFLSDGNFRDFDTIVVGIFAFRTRPELAAKTAQLHEWVRAGGNLVTLYHRPWDNWDPATTAPAFLEIGKPSLRWRVTDENAEVTYLEPDHPLLNTPNKIGPEDWAGWHKERGLYFASKWDEAYTPLFSMTDPDEEPHLGSLLSAKIDKGRHTHTSLILHHQMEKLVPGAFRLMANLVAPVS